jgi:pimeloyl-ACP methyl ester carboxylesterase
VGVLERNNVSLSGPVGGRPMLFAHGFGCDQQMWRYVAPAFADEYRVVLFDHVGAGGSDHSAYSRSKYGTLHGYADDVIAPRPVGEYVHRQLPNSTLVYMRATGHCPNLSAPEETIDAIRAFL